MNEEHVKDFLLRSGDKEIYPGTIVEENHGFMVYEILDDAVMVLQAYGNGKYWDNYSMALAKKYGKSKVRMATSRNPKTFERKFGYKSIIYVMEKEVI